MNKRSTAWIFIVVWSLINRHFFWPVSRLLALVSDRMRDQVRSRGDHQLVVKKLSQLRQNFGRCAVFFCSSAGEYEQAQPLIERLSSDTDTFCHVFFFSVSGASFVMARKEQVSWSMSPPDDAERWNELFAALRPDRTVIVRHELWPSFLWCASFSSKIIVINGVVPSLFGRQSKWRERVNLAVKSWLFRFVDHVCAVSSEDAKFFERWLGLPVSKITMTGDTKYDRVLQRAQAKKATVSELRTRFQALWAPPGRDQTLIGGSVHLADVEWLIEALRDAGLKRLRILLVPHDVSTLNIGRIYAAVKEAGHSVELLSDLEGANNMEQHAHPRVLIADEMGRLSELYGVADIAWVGGAVHNKIHNVLEAAAWGLPVICGPRYQNSQEAVCMKERGALMVVNSAHEIAGKLADVIENPAHLGAMSLVFASSMSGATMKVNSAIERVVGGASR